jgi:hypothetical protein
MPGESELLTVGSDGSCGGALRGVVSIVEDMVSSHRTDKMPRRLRGDVMFPKS